MPFRHVAVFANGRRLQLNEPVPPWLGDQARDL
jgi:hypothetical protein